MANEMGFFNEAKKQDKKPETTEMNDEEMSNMNIKGPAPLYKEPTRCQITDIKFFKEDKKTKEISKKTNEVTEYTKFSAKVSFSNENDGEFTLNYSGGRIYEDPTGKVSTYIGPKSQIGKMKNSAIEAKVNIGKNLPELREALLNRFVMLQEEIFVFNGESYPKSVIVSMEK